MWSVPPVARCATTAAMPKKVGAAGAPEDPPRQRAATGSVEVWSRVTLADGLEVNVEPGRAGLSPEQVRALVRGITALYRDVRANQEPGAQRQEP